MPPPIGPASASGPIAGHTKSAQDGSNSTGNVITAINICVTPAVRHGLALCRARLAAIAAPMARPRKKQPSTLVVEEVLAPSKSIIRRVHKSWCAKAAAPLTKTSNETLSRLPGSRLLDSDCPRESSLFFRFLCIRTTITTHRPIDNGGD